MCAFWVNLGSFWKHRKFPAATKQSCLPSPCSSWIVVLIIYNAGNVLRKRKVEDGCKWCPWKMSVYGILTVSVKMQLSLVHNYPNTISENTKLTYFHVSTTWKTEDSSISLNADNIVAIFLIACTCTFRRTKSSQLSRGSSAPDNSFYSLSLFLKLNLPHDFSSSHPSDRISQVVELFVFPSCLHWEVCRNKVQAFTSDWWEKYQNIRENQKSFLKLLCRWNTAEGNFAGVEFTHHHRNLRNSLDFSYISCELCSQPAPHRWLGCWPVFMSL